MKNSYEKFIKLLESVEDAPTTPPVVGVLLEAYRSGGVEELDKAYKAVCNGDMQHLNLPHFDENGNIIEVVS